MPNHLLCDLMVNGFIEILCGTARWRRGSAALFLLLRWQSDGGDGRYSKSRRRGKRDKEAKCRSNSAFTEVGPCEEEIKSPKMSHEEMMAFKEESNLELGTDTRGIQQDNNISTPASAHNSPASTPDDIDDSALRHARAQGATLIQSTFRRRFAKIRVKKMKEAAAAELPTTVNNHYQSSVTPLVEIPSVELWRTISRGNCRAEQVGVGQYEVVRRGLDKCGRWCSNGQVVEFLAELPPLREIHRQIQAVDYSERSFKWMAYNENFATRTCSIMNAKVPAHATGFRHYTFTFENVQSLTVALMFMTGNDIGICTKVFFDREGRFHDKKREKPGHAMIATDSDMDISDNEDNIEDCYFSKENATEKFGNNPFDKSFSIDVS